MLRLSVPRTVTDSATPSGSAARSLSATSVSTCALSAGWLLPPSAFSG